LPSLAELRVERFLQLVLDLLVAHAVEHPAT
jgi:hypothetical protein